MLIDNPTQPEAPAPWWKTQAARQKDTGRPWWKDEKAARRRMERAPRSDFKKLGLGYLLIK